MDTRAAQPTYDGQYQGIGLRTATSDTAMTVTNRAGIPANATAVVLNVTVTQPSATGWITVHPCGTSAPNASNVNFVASDTILAMDRFVRPRSWARPAIMVTYHLGQALIVWGVLAAS